MQISAEKFFGIAIACLILCLSACGESEPINAEKSLACGTDGTLVAEIYGGIRASLDWDAGMLECEGMPRPKGEGARLRFAGPADSADEKLKLVFILGLPDLIEGETASELPLQWRSGRKFGVPL